MMPIGQDTCRVVGAQIGAQPTVLRRAGRTIHVAVERNDVPGAQGIAVITTLCRAGIRAEIGKIGRCARGYVIVIAGRGTCQLFEATPTGRVTLLIVCGRASVVGVVAGGKYNYFA